MSSQYENQLNNANSTLQTILNNDFFRLYVLSNNNPSNTEYRQQLSNIQSNINDQLRNMFTISNNIDRDIRELNRQISEMNQNINNERQKNVGLKNDLGITDEENITAKELIKDYKDIYDQRYLRNWGILLSILACTTAVIYSSRV